MVASARDVIVLGWWAPEQCRISFCHLLERELGLNVGAAKTLLDARLDDRKPTILPALPAVRALEVAREIAAMGAEVRVLSGHVGGEDLVAEDELARIESSLQDFHARSFPNRHERGRAASDLCPDLRVT